MKRLMQVSLTILFTLTLVVASLVGCRPPVAAPLDNTRALTGQLSGDIRVGGGLTVDDNVSVGGALAVTGDTTLTGALGVTGAVTFADGLGVDYAIINAPTGIASATPALYVNSLGVSNLVEVQDGGTPVVQAFNGGGVKVAAPTAIATAVPAFYVDSLGVSNIFEVRDAQTPVAYIANGGAAVFSSSITGASAAIGGGYASSGCDLSSAGLLQCSGGGDWNGAAIALNASSNFATNINTGSSSGALTLGGVSGTVAINSSDWDITTEGNATGIGALTMNGLLTGSLGATISGATTSVNVDSNFGTNINTGSSSGALTLGGGSGTVAINSTGWDISTAGVFTGTGDITAATALSGGFDITVAPPAYNTAATALDVIGQPGGTTSGDGVGRNGGNVTLTAGAGSAKSGAGINDGNGGDVVLLGGAKGGSTGGSETDGAVLVGSPTLATAKATNLLGVQGPLEVDGAGRFDSTLLVAGAATLDGGIVVDTSNFTVDGTSGAVVSASSVTADSAVVGGGYGSTGCTLSNAGALQCDDAATVDGAVTAGDGTGNDDVTLTPLTNGNNALARNQFIGLPRIAFVGFGAGSNPGAETVNHMDDDPTGEYAPINATVTEAEGSGDNTFRYGASSYKASFLDTAIDGSGFKATVGSQSLEDEESVGLWIYPSEAITSGVLQLLLTDDNGAREYDLPALTATTWNWAEVNISALNAGTGDAVTEVGILMTDAGADAKGAFTIYVDQIWTWDAEDEDEILVGGASVVIQRDGVLGVVDPADGTNLAEGTNYIIHYEAAKSYLVWITDEAAAYDLAMIAY